MLAATLALAAGIALAQCGDPSGGGCACCKNKMDVKVAETFYQAEGCGMTFDAAQAKKLNYKCKGCCDTRLVLTQKTKDGTVSLSAASWPAKQGKGSIEVRLRNADRAAIDDAKVTVKLAMAGHRMAGDTKPIVLTEGKKKDGLYTAKVDLSMKGKWVATVEVTRGDKTETYKFEMEVS